MRYAVALALPAALMVQACGSTVEVNEDALATNAMTTDAMPANDAMMANGGMAGDNMAMVGDGAPMTAQSFANTAAASDRFEIESARIAQAKAQTPALKEFAGMMIQDHTKSTADLKAAARSITPNPTLTAEQQANIAALNNASGASFDTLYIQQQVAAHQKALAALQGYAANGDNAQLKQFASKTAPVVQGHLTRVQST